MRLVTMQLHVAWDDDQWVASEPVTGMYGEGDTPTEALNDCIVGLVRLREDLEANRDRLGSGLAEDLAFLQASVTWDTNTPLGQSASACERAGA